MESMVDILDSAFTICIQVLYFIFNLIIHFILLFCPFLSEDKTYKEYYFRLWNSFSENVNDICDKENF